MWEFANRNLGWKPPHGQGVTKLEGLSRRAEVFNRLVVLVAMIVALLPICGDGSEV